MVAIKEGKPPYSLGKLIDWKPGVYSLFAEGETVDAPYSLGKLIDWKHQMMEEEAEPVLLSNLPTR